MLNLKCPTYQCWKSEILETSGVTNETFEMCSGWESNFVCNFLSYSLDSTFRIWVCLKIIENIWKYRLLQNPSKSCALSIPLVGLPYGFIGDINPVVSLLYRHYMTNLAGKIQQFWSLNPYWIAICWDFYINYGE
jgi:hypothetical protein